LPEAPRERGECAIAVASANIFAAKTGLTVCSDIFETMGARSTSAKYGFDRFWRNVRTHTLHNPTAYKLRNIGNWALNGEIPEVTVYS
jgi:alkylation response protein AidB-like acyl-CoA dehydrogenase